MSSALLKSVVHKNKLYRDWKFTTDNNEYQIKQVNFRTYERILRNMIEESKQIYYFDTFSAQKMTHPYQYRKHATLQMKC